MNLGQRKPYTYKITEESRGFLLPGQAEVLYKGKRVRTYSGWTDEELKKHVFLLNGAYQLGFSDGTKEPTAP
jgi:hypothetical protein